MNLKTFLYRLTFPFCFWICSCTEFVGDDSDCPRHGHDAGFQRMAITLIACALILVIAWTLKEIGL